MVIIVAFDRPDLSNVFYEMWNRNQNANINFFALLLDST